jgi:capsular polysaccharide transport system permease protein
MQRSLFIQKNVIKALMIRELKTRFGKSKFGMVWLLLEPLFHLVFLSIIWGTLHHGSPGIDYPLFLVSGIVPWLFFLRCIFQCSNAVQANKGIFFFKNVKPLDTMIARIFLELVISFFTLILFLTGFILLGFGEPINDPARLLYIAALFMLFTTGVSVICGTMGAIVNDFEKGMKLLTRPLYFTSGIFFPTHSIPQPYRDWLLWNPLVHYFEMFRNCLFASYRMEFADINYMIYWALGTLCIGLALYRAKRFELVKTR